MYMYELLSWNYGTFYKNVSRVRDRRETSACVIPPRA